jgi:hypothetical protein
VIDVWMIGQRDLGVRVLVLGGDERCDGERCCGV